MTHDMFGVYSYWYWQWRRRRW